MTATTTFTLRIWDLPTRVFHALLAVCVVGLVITGNIGGNAMVWHFRLGYAVFSLLLFRLVWGFIGGHWSRWSQLPLRPQQLWAYVRGQSDMAHMAGHNPMGSWSVLALLGMLALQVSTGLVSDDEIANAGPLTSLVSGAWVSAATQWHKGWGKAILLGLVMLHLLALIWYRWRKGQALVPAMWHGDKALVRAVTASRDTASSRLLALFVFLLCSAVVSYVVNLAA
jgi:cytochrome b